MDDNKIVASIKATLDILLSEDKIFKMFDSEKIAIERDNNFYDTLGKITLFFQDVLILYNRIRNYVTKKPYSTKKVKLNFNNYNLLGGWDKNKEEDNLGLLFIKDNKYYLGIMDKDTNAKQSFREFQAGEDNYQKMVYKQIPSCSKYYSSKQIFPQNPPENIKKYLSKEFDKKKMTPSQLVELIKYVAEDFIPNYKPLHDETGKCYFNYQFKPYEEYDSWNDFCKDLDRQSYSIYFKDVDAKYIHSLVEEGKLYLFEIYNKDFSSYSKGKPNLHTLYWKALFEKENIENVTYQLNGGGEVFYRAKSYVLKENDIHKANHPINKRRDETKTSSFPYDLIKNKRYTVDQFEFHVPITINPNAFKPSRINENVKRQIADEKNIHIIGIDRGERNLLYVSIIDLQGNIKEQYSLNEIVNEYHEMKYTTDYQQLLNKIQENRQKERKSWTSIENIKELKSGYMSQVINVVVNLMIKYNAIIVLEDLNTGFKNSRLKIEKQIYQTFENALVNKLSLYINKNYSYQQNGGLYRPLQLVNKPDGKANKSRQNGFIFYVPAWKTSKIDPTTGFTSNINFHYFSIDASKELIENFRDIYFEHQSGMYCFEINDKDFNKKEETDKTWKVYSYSNRLIYDKNKKSYKSIQITEEFNLLFSNFGININKNLKEQILQQNAKSFFEELLYLLKLTFQLRNSSDKEDYIVSPVRNKHGKFFDSREGDKTLPINADANGAYSIALKGLMLVNSIKKQETDFKITNKNWLEFIRIINE